MRVIAGTYRSRILQTPAGLATRPTSDRLRETLFNILAPRIEGATFADLYAGSGAVGIEALSRGARHVWFAEKAEKPLAAIRSNLKTLGIRSGFELESGGTHILLKRLAVSGFPIDIVFLDPPYDAEEEYTRTLTTLGTADLLAPGALVLAEHTRKVHLAETYGTLRRARVHQQSDAALSFFSREG